MFLDTANSSSIYFFYKKRIYVNTITKFNNKIINRIQLKILIMEKIFICSDVHGDYNAFSKFIELSENNPIIICGDLTPYSQSFAYLFSTLENDLFIVKGNCDNAYDFSIANINIPPRIRLENFFNRQVLITHGDLIKYPYQSPYKLENGDIFISGHTHVVKLFKDKNAVINLNPGSLSRPRGEFDSSYAILYKNKIEIRALYDNKVILNLNI